MTMCAPTGGEEEAYKYPYSNSNSGFQPEVVYTLKSMPAGMDLKNMHITNC